jgi:hypothetical protein
MKGLAKWLIHCVGKLLADVAFDDERATEVVSGAGEKCMTNPEFAVLALDDEASDRPISVFLLSRSSYFRRLPQLGHCHRSAGQ